MMSRKSLVVMQNEFMRRVTSKTFILTTLLGPALLIVFFAVIIMISISAVEDSFDEYSSEETSSLRIAVVDETGVLNARILSQDTGDHVLVTADLNAAHEGVLDGLFDAYVRIPPELISGTRQPMLYSQEGSGRGVRGTLGGIIERALEDHLLADRNVSADVRSILDRVVWLDMVRLTDEGEEAGAPEGYVIIGGALGMIMYITMLIYGSLILYGTLEERTTRVVEIIVSSVRPFDLLMGKVLGIGLIGFVQMAVWMLMFLGAMILAGPIIGLFIDPAVYDLPATATSQEILAATNISLPQISVGLLVWFILYFIGGYLLYGGLFATVGTLVDSPQESQSLMVPLLMPMIISIIFLSPVMMNPDSGLALGLSIFPLTSPVPMIVRMSVMDVPFWQLLLSYGLLVLSFIGSIWVSARIYRASILMYGKKPSLRVIASYLRNG